jgi:alpha-glucoside transport system permease protein
LLFLLPALVLLGVLVVYPTIATFVRSLFDRQGDGFVGLGNYKDMFTSDATLRSIKNNMIWMVVAPTIVTALGLIFAVLSERVRWSTAFKFVIFMPMAISFLASGVIFRLVYQADPDQGLANAALVSIHDTFRPSSNYPNAIARPDSGLDKDGGALVSSDTFEAGSATEIPLVGLAAEDVPAGAQAAATPSTPAADAVAGVVWLDFVPGGGGETGVIDSEEKGLPGMAVQIVDGDRVVASAKTDAHGAFTAGGLSPGTAYALRLPASNFAQPYNGVTWLGPSLVTPAIIAAYIWMWAGFAMVLIAAGLAAISRDALEAARVDGATEWQVFRRVTVPLLAPVLVVVLVTLIINVLKVFDLVFIIAPGSTQDDASVLALQMWRVSFSATPDRGLGSALAIFLFLLVVPAMLFNIRRFRREQS